MTTPKYTLENGEERHTESPETFWMPPRRDRERLKPGALVKCMFRSSEVHDGFSAERMWVTVKAVRDDGTYLGKLPEPEPGPPPRPRRDSDDRFDSMVKALSA
jgi:hypothetical protein